MLIIGKLGVKRSRQARPKPKFTGSRVNEVPTPQDRGTHEPRTNYKGQVVGESEDLTKEGVYGQERNNNNCNIKSESISKYVPKFKERGSSKGRIHLLVYMDDCEFDHRDFNNCDSLNAKEARDFEFEKRKVNHKQKLEAFRYFVFAGGKSRKSEKNKKPKARFRQTPDHESKSQVPKCQTLPVFQFMNISDSSNKLIIARICPDTGAAVLLNVSPSDKHSQEFGVSEKVVGIQQVKFIAITGSESKDYENLFVSDSTAQKLKFVDPDVETMISKPSNHICLPDSNLTLLNVAEDAITPENETECSTENAFASVGKVSKNERGQTEIFRIVVLCSIVNFIIFFCMNHLMSNYSDIKLE